MQDGDLLLVLVDFSLVDVDLLLVNCDPLLQDGDLLLQGDTGPAALVMLPLQLLPEP